MNTQPSAAHAEPVRTEYFDYLRVFATFCIMLIHVAAYKWHVEEISTVNWQILNVFKCFNRPPVLIFFMISGALFLKREIPLKRIYSRYIFRLAVAFVFWDIFYAVATHWRKGVIGILQKIFSCNYHLWFLLALIGLYMCIPFFREIVSSKRKILYFLTVAFVVGFLLPETYDFIIFFGNEAIVRYTEMIGGHLYNLRLNTFLGYSFFFLAGYYIHTYGVEKRLRIFLYVLSTITAVTGVLLTAASSLRAGYPSDAFHDSFTLHEMLEALAIFVFFKYNIKGRPRTDGLTRKLSGYCFGIYLLHDIIILKIETWFGISATTFHPLFGVPLTAILTFLIGFGITWLLKKIPLINKYLV
ncbi:MAG: acyltransferase [Lachnospiraceae bacterium]|jgi:surface polysaccharide O-acyltransferase-like enzyme